MSIYRLFIFLVGYSATVLGVDPVHVTRLEQLDLDHTLRGNQLFLGNRNIASISDEVAHAIRTDPRCAGLICLDLSRNKLREIPAELVQIPTLTMLTAHENPELRKLPNVWDTPALQAIWLFRTSLRELPAAVVHLRELRFLLLSGTSIQCLPDGPWDLPNLEIITLGHTYLENIPEALMRLPKLHKLDVGMTQIREFPAFARGMLPELQELNIGHTQISILPEELFYLPQLRTVGAEETPLKKTQFWRDMYAQLLQTRPDPEHPGESLVKLYPRPKPTAELMHTGHDVMYNLDGTPITTTAAPAEHSILPGWLGDLWRTVWQ